MTEFRHRFPSAKLRFADARKVGFVSQKSVGTIFSHSLSSRLRDSLQLNVQGASPRHDSCVDGDAMTRQDWLLALRTFIVVYLIL